MEFVFNFKGGTGVLKCMNEVIYFKQFFFSSTGSINEYYEGIMIFFSCLSALEI